MSVIFVILAGYESRHTLSCFLLSFVIVCLLDPLVVGMVMAFSKLIGFVGILLALSIAAALKIASLHWLKGDFTNVENES
jgi:hypothetical protein